MKVKAVQNGNLSFEINQEGYKYIVDAEEVVGGENKGPSPKGLLLGGLAGCTGMDVASILKKMRIEYDNFEVTVDAGLTSEHPKIYKDIVLEFRITGSDDLDIDKLKRAVELSQYRYCGVSEMLRRSSVIRYKIYLNGRIIYEE